MASNYTSNYGLCQWEPGDSFMRTEFNRDNAKVDEALAEKADRTEVDALGATVAGKADAGSVNSRFTAVNSSISGINSSISSLSARVEVRVGSYTGNGAATRTISLGFTPKAVLVEAAHGLRDGMGYGGLAVSGSPCKNGPNAAVEVVSGGFRVGAVSNLVSTNDNGFVYHYIAFK